jgi:Complex I intermediate-associated protein 30 (CIA30)
LKNLDCLQQFSSYRATFELDNGQWTTIRLPWTAFQGYGRGANENALDVSTLKRLGVVAIGKAMDVTIGLSSIRFFGDTSNIALEA